MRQTSSVLYIAVDSLIPAHGKSVPGIDEFTAALDHAGIPAVWLTSRSRLQFDEPRRRLGHQHPFIAEDGCVVCMPEGYFHLRPESPGSSTKRAPTTLRLGRFTCIPAAEPLPAASNALESLSEDTGIDVVTLRSLSPRELVQNSGLPLREAELSRQRDFDELFFFAGTSETDIQRFTAEANHRKLQLRQHGVLWSLAIGASFAHCIRDLSRLYDRALRSHAHIVGVATSQLAPGLFPYCERTILLSDHESEDSSLVHPIHGGEPEDRAVPYSQADRNSSAGADQPMPLPTMQFPLRGADTWELLLESVLAKKPSAKITR